MIIEYDEVWYSYGIIYFHHSNRRWCNLNRTEQGLSLSMRLNKATLVWLNTDNMTVQPHSFLMSAL